MLFRKLAIILFDQNDLYLRLKITDDKYPPNIKNCPAPRPTPEGSSENWSPPVHSSGKIMAFPPRTTRKVSHSQPGPAAPPSSSPWITINIHQTLDPARVQLPDRHLLNKLEPALADRTGILSLSKKRTTLLHLSMQSTQKTCRQESILPLTAMG